MSSDPVCPEDAVCPEVKALEAALLGLASVAESDSIESHLAECPKCMERTRHLSAEDTWVDLVRRQQSRAPSIALPAYANELMDRLKKLPASDKTFVSLVDDAQAEGSVQSAGPTTFPQGDPRSEEQHLAATTEVLGNYILLEKIGAGGMGQVFKARHRRMDRTVALKVLPAKLMRNQQAIARFEREVKAAARINHPNIVSAYDADQAGDVHFLVMEYVEGSDLSAMVKETGPFSVERALHCILQAARGLEAAHAEGIVHRDIKPANLLLDKKGTVKILDMGLARILDDVVEQAELTATGAVMGTVDYMAPEQALDTKTADARADIYGLGCSLFYLLSGHATYQGETLTARLLAHQGQPIPDLRSVRSEVGEPLAAIFNKMVAKRVVDRYQSMSALIADLERVATPAPIAQLLTETVGGGNAKSVLARGVNPLADTNVPSPASAGRGGIKLRKRLLLCAGAAALLMLLSPVVIRLTTKDGTLVVEVNEPGAEIEVLNEKGEVKIRRKSDKDPITISVDAGKHRIRVHKAGFLTYAGDEIEIKTGEETPIKATLEPLTPAGIARAKPSPAPSEVVKAAPADRPNKPLPNGPFVQWVKDVRLLSAEKQLEAVSRKLQELNPGFDGRLTHQIANGVVRELSFSTDKVTDITPVQALSGLEILSCGGPGSLGVLADVSPLKGLKLTNLFCGFSKVADLSPLIGMPLTELNCLGSQVADLSPLQGMPLKRLEISHTPVTDLSPLKGMPLESLKTAATPVWDLSPLQGMPLTELYFDHTQVADLWPLEGMPLTSISLAHSPVADLSPLRGMQLPLLHCGGTSVFDLSPLQGMPLTRLEFSFTPVSDLTPLKGMPLTELVLTKSRVDDLSPLKGMPLTSLSCLQIPASDLSPLEGMELSSFALTPVSITRGIDVIRQMTSLKSIAYGLGNDERLSRKDFWTKYDAGEFKSPRPIATPNDPAFQQWMKEVAPLPAEKQVAAVVKKLQELNPAFDGQESHRIEFDVVVELTFYAAVVTDISPVRALPRLETLSCSGSGFGSLADLSPLKGMKLTNFSCAGTQVSDLSPITGMPLKSLDFTNTNVSDLAPLQGMPLKVLKCGKTPVSDLSPLKGMALAHLDCGETRVSDLSPLRGMSLSVLQTQLTAISDLSPLAGMKLSDLHCGKTQVSDLSPLKGIPLAELWVENTRVSNLSVLGGMNLKRLWLTPGNITQGMDVIRPMRSLTTIGTHVMPREHYPSDAFWKKYDAGGFGKPHAPADSSKTGAN